MKNVEVIYVHSVWRKVEVTFISKVDKPAEEPTPYIFISLTQLFIKANEGNSSVLLWH